VDHTGDFGDQLNIDGNQIASIPDPSTPGQYLVVVVGGSGGAAPGCPSGTSTATGYGVGVGTPTTLATAAAWSSRYFAPESCQAKAPVLAGGGATGGAIGLLEDEGPGLSGGGSDGVYYRQFDAATEMFGAPALVSDETRTTQSGADELDLSQDSSGGVYATWLDSRGYELAYRPSGGVSWGGCGDDRPSHRHRRGRRSRRGTGQRRDRVHAKPGLWNPGVRGTGQLLPVRWVERSDSYLCARDCHLRSTPATPSRLLVLSNLKCAPG
jgi:hypothetical protein